MKLEHSVRFTFDLALARGEAIAFVRDVSLSLSRAAFIEDLQILERGGCTVVSACLPVNASLFGQRRLRFRSELRPAPDGASLRGLRLPGERPGWAQVSGRARVEPLPFGSRVSYQFDIAIHLHLPEPEKWGGHALLKMIEFTATRVLERVTAAFPEAVKEAALEAEAALSPP